jgi:hypothetical protein
VYIATPTDPSVSVWQFDNPLFEQIVNSIEDTFLSHGWATAVPARDDLQWGKHEYPSQAVGALIARHMEACDLILNLTGASVFNGANLPRPIPVISYMPTASTLRDLSDATHLSDTDVDALPHPGEHTIVAVPTPETIPAHIRSVLGVRVLSAPLENEKALIDIGSNSVKFSIFSLREGRQPLPIPGQSQRESISIADSVRESGRIDEAKLRQLGKVLARYCESAQTRNAAVVVVGTEAIRQAVNRQEVERIIFDVCGVDLRVMTQAAEAEAIERAVGASLRPTETAAALNLGGSSVQLISDIGSQKTRSYLLRFGTKDIIASHPWDGPITSAGWEAARQHVRNLIISAGVSAQSSGYLFHTGGELDFLLRCNAPLTVSRVSDRHVSMISVDDFADFATHFASRGPEKIAAETGLQGPWLAGAVASNAIAIESAMALQADLIIPSDLNVTDGIVSQ